MMNHHCTILSVISESSFVRNQMIELLLLQYVPPPPSSSSTETIGNLPLSLPDQLIRAMRQIVNEGSTTTDYENVTIGIDITTAAAATAVAVATTANNAQLDKGSSGNMHRILTSYLTKSSYAREKLYVSSLIGTVVVVVVHPRVHDQTCLLNSIMHSRYYMTLRLNPIRYQSRDIHISILGQ